MDNRINGLKLNKAGTEYTGRKVSCPACNGKGETLNMYESIDGKVVMDFCVACQGTGLAKK